MNKSIQKPEDSNSINSEDKDSQEEIVSKSAIKRALHDILLFGEKLLLLNPKKLSKLPLSPLLLSELDLAKKLKVDNSRRRQMQRVAKILRSENHEEIQRTYNELQQQNRQHQQSANPSEKWCAQLLESNDSLSEFIQRYPNINRQQLGQLIRNAKKEKKLAAVSKKNQQRLFKVVQETLLKELN
ncbi:MAG: ribosome-associated protein [Cellvibrionaceae bacterium]|jgi:ribosome-associated protein